MHHMYYVATAGLLVLYAWNNPIHNIRHVSSQCFVKQLEIMATEQWVASCCMNKMKIYS